MHETIVAGEILREALAEGSRRGDTRITQLRVKVGELESLSPEALRTAFRDQARGTSARGAELVLEVVPASFSCERCGHSQPMRTAGDASSCTRCGHTSLRLDGRGWTVTLGHGSD